MNAYETAKGEIPILPASECDVHSIIKTDVYARLFYANYISLKPFESEEEDGIGVAR